MECVVCKSCAVPNRREEKYAGRKESNVLHTMIKKKARRKKLTYNFSLVSLKYKQVSVVSVKMTKISGEKLSYFGLYYNTQLHAVIHSATSSQSKFSNL